MTKRIAPGVRIREYKSGKRVIAIAFSYRGTECRETLGHLDPSKRSALQYAKNLRGAILDKIERGTFDYAEYFPDSPRARLFGHAQAAVTVRQAQAGLIDDLRTAGREETTLAAYERSAARINQYLGDVRLRELLPEHLRELMRRRQVSRKTWNNDLIPLRKALRRAVMDGALNFSPLERVDVDELVPALKRPRPDPFTLGEISALLEAAAGHCERAHNLIQTALYTGLRLEELVALTWSDVDLKAGSVEISKAAQLSIGSAVAKAPKTPTSARTVELLPKAAAALKRQQAITRFRGEHVFTRWTGFEPFSTYNQLRRRWQTVLVRAGVRARALKQCRHTYASHMLSSGHNPLYVASQLGHSGTALLDVYGTWVKDWKDEEERKYGT